MRLNYKLLIACVALLFITAAQAQNSVSIGTTATNQRAVLLLVGNNQGLVIPSVSNPANINAQSSDAGMIVYNTTDQLMYYYNGTQWTSLGSSGSASQSISITGNQITVGTGGTSANISSTAPSSAGQFFMWDGTKWNATSISGGDISNANSSNGNFTVTGIQGKGVTLPSTGVQYLAYDATQAKWVFQTPAGSVPTLANGQILTGNGTANSATTLAGDASLSAGTLTVTGIQGKSIPALPTSTVFPIQLLSFNGTNNSWEFKDLVAANLMTKTVYDPTNKAGDVFDLTKHTGWPANASGVLTNNGTGTLSWAAVSGTGTVTNVTGTAPLSVATGTTTPVISMTQANGTTNGYLSSTDWTNFNNKVSIGGDLGGTSASPTVSKVNGSTWPSNAAGVLTNNGSGSLSWAPSSGLSSTLSSANIFVGNASNVATGVAVSGDIGITNAGVTSISNTAATGSNIVNAINASSASINGARVSPSFGSQNVATTGTLSAGATTVSGLTIGTTAINWPANASGVLTNNGTGTLTWAAASGTGTVTNVTGVAPISVVTGTTTPVISMTQANGTTNGYLSFTDWTTFNNKQGALILTTLGSSGAATLVGNTLNIPNYAGTTYTAGTGLTLASNAFSVNTSQNISTLSNLTSNGLIKTSGGTGALSIASAGTDYAPATSGTSILYGNGTGGFSNVTVGTGLSFSAGTLSASGFTNPMTTLGDIIYENATPAAARLAGNTTTTKQFLSQTGTGTVSAAPAWAALAATDIPNLDASKITTGTLGTARGGTGITTAPTANQILTTNGSSAVTWINQNALSTVGTITSGTWNGSVIGSSYGGAGTVNGILKANGAGLVSAATAGTDFQSPLTLTTTGTTGAATYTSATSTLNIPNYTGWGLTGNTGTSSSSNFIGTSDNVALSFRANNLKAGLIDPSATGATFFGYQSGNSNSGSSNTGIGYYSLFNNTTGASNTALGHNSLSATTTGGNNTAVGESALVTNATGSQNTAIGNNADVASSALTNATAIGYGAIVGASNSLVLGGTGSNAVKVGIGVTTPVSVLDVNGDVHLSQITAPSTTTDKLYNVGGNLFWNGTNISSGNGWSLSGNSLSGTEFIGSTNAQDLVFKANGTERLRVANSTGYVGIGTASPANQLDVTANLASPSNAISATNNGTGNGIYGYAPGGGVGIWGFSPTGTGLEGQSTSSIGVYGTSTNGTAISAYSANAIGLQASTGSASSWAGYFSGNVAMMGGSVGIGTSSPTTTLDIAGSLHLTGPISGPSTDTGPTPQIAYGYNSSASGGYGSIAVGYNAVASGTASVALGQQVTASGYSSVALGYGITASGNSAVGIGLPGGGANITQTNQFAVVGGRASIGHVGYTSNPILHVYNPSTSSGLGLMETLRVTGGGQTTGDGPVVNFQSAFGGTTATTYQDWIGAAIGSPYSGSYQGDLTFYTNNGGQTTGSIASSTYERMRINSQGNVGINTSAPDMKLSVNGSADKTGGGPWSTFSDKRVKKDIFDFNDGLSVLSKINPIRFKYNGLGGYPDDGKEYVGVIAQEIQKVAPYMISTVNKKLKDTDKEKTDLLMYDGNALTYILVNAVKEQQKLIEEQKKEIEALKNAQTKTDNNAQSELIQLKAEIANIKKALGMEASNKKK